MCFNPLKGFINERGEVIKVTSTKVKSIRYSNGKLISIYNDNEIQNDDIVTFIDIPCRHCEECYSQMRLEWISRATAEMQLHSKALYITLTYRDYNDGETILPPVAEMVTEEGEILRHHTLRYRDFQLFMKRLRKKFPERKIRFMVCGEYGSRTYRPHYHAIIYGIDVVDFSDMLPHNRNKHGDILFSSVELDNIWQLGYTLTGSADNGTIAYVAGYVAKKFTAVRTKDWYDYTNIVPPFIHSSNRPGLGSEYIQTKFDRFNNEYDYMMLPALNDRSTPTKIKLWTSAKNKYKNSVYNDIGFDNFNNRYYSMIRRREKLIDTRFKLLHTDMSKCDYSNSQKVIFKSKIKRLRGDY